MLAIYRVAVVLCLVFLFIAGCAQEKPVEEPAPATPPPPPEPTADEIYRDLRQSVEILWRPLQGGFGLSLAEVDGAIANLRSVRGGHAAHIHQKEASDRLLRDVDKLIADAKKEGRWRPILGGCAVYKEIDPGNTRHKKVEEYATLMLARPKVQCVGFSTVDGQTYIMLTVEPAEGGEQKNYRVRVGEEFADVIRVEEIIGNQQKVRLNYLPVNDSDWLVLGPSERN